MSTDLAQFEGSIPEHYDQGLGPNIFVDFGSDLAKRVAHVKPNRVLELAAGTGIVTRMLRDELDDTCELIATDLSEPMLRVASNKFTDGEQVTFQQVDATALPFDDASFDAVVCQFGVMFFPDKEISFRETNRVLKQGGRYIFNVWSSFDENPFARVAQETAEQFFPDDPPAFYYLPFSYSDAFEIEESLLRAGFVEATAEVQRLDKKVEDYEQFARGLVFGNPLVEEIRARASAEPETVQAAIAAALRKEFGDESSVMPLQELVVTAIRPS